MYSQKTSTGYPRPPVHLPVDDDDYLMPSPHNNNLVPGGMPNPPTPSYNEAYLALTSDFNTPRFQFPPPASQFVTGENVIGIGFVNDLNNNFLFCL